MLRRHRTSGQSRIGRWLAMLVGLLVLCLSGTASAELPSNGKIAFSSNQDIMVMRQDGSGITNLTNSPAQDAHPDWSPDGSKIAFFSDFNIWTMNADGTGATQLTDSGLDMLPAWSPDSSKIAFTRGQEIYYKIGFTRGQEIYVMDSDGLNQVNVTNSFGFDTDPSWSPDGTTLAYVRTPWDIYTINVNGTSATQLTDSVGNDGYPAWSPDGETIAFASDRSGSWQVYTMNSDGTNETQLTDNVNENSQPEWSPDGSKILVAGETLYTMNPDGTEQAKLGIEQFGGYPSWQPLVPGHHPPVASIAPRSTALLGEEVTFTSTSTDDGSIVSQKWDTDNDGQFDDGTGTSVVKSFSSPGVHIVRLSATDNEGATDAISRSIQMVERPETVIQSGPSGTTSDPGPTFQFTSVPAGAAFDCRIDGGSFAPCTSPYTSARLSHGPHVFEVRARDQDDHVDPTPAVRSFTVDEIPDTIIKSGPDSSTHETSAAFKFESSEAGSTFQCRLDSGPWAVCVSPWTYSGLSVGSHSFEVAATDATGNLDPSPVIFFWTVKSPDTTVFKVKISRVQVSGPAKFKTGKKVTYKVKITNSGNAKAKGVKLKVNGKGVKAKKAVGTIAAGKSKTVKIRLKPKKPGKVELTFKVTSKNTAVETVKKKITVRK